MYAFERQGIFRMKEYHSAALPGKLSLQVTMSACLGECVVVGPLLPKPVFTLLAGGTVPGAVFAEQTS